MRPAPAAAAGNAGTPPPSRVVWGAAEPIAGAPEVDASRIHAQVALNNLLDAIGKHLESNGGRPDTVATVKNMADRSKRKMFYTIAGPVGVAAFVAATGATAGAAAIAGAPALGGWVMKKGWAQSDPKIAKSHGFKKFEAALGSGDTEYIDNAVLQHTRFYLQRRDLSKLCDEFVQLQLDLNHYKEVKKRPIENCVQAEGLAYAALVVCKRAALLQEDFASFEKLYLWMTARISAWQRHLNETFITNAKSAIREQVNGSKKAHRYGEGIDQYEPCCCALSKNKCDDSLKSISTPNFMRTRESICYRLVGSTGKLMSPKNSNMHTYAWKFKPEPRLWTDAANEVFAEQNVVACIYDADLIKRAEERVGDVGRGTIAAPPAAPPAAFSAPEQALDNVKAGAAPLSRRRACHWVSRRA